MSRGGLPPSALPLAFILAPFSAGFRQTGPPGRLTHLCARSALLSGTKKESDGILNVPGLRDGLPTGSAWPLPSALGLLTFPWRSPSLAAFPCLYRSGFRCHAWLSWKGPWGRFWTFPRSLLEPLWPQPPPDRWALRQASGISGFGL